MATASTTIQGFTKVNGSGSTEAVEPRWNDAPYPCGVVTIDVVSIQVDVGGSVGFSVQLSQDGQDWFTTDAVRPISAAGRYRLGVDLPLSRVRLAYSCASASDVAFKADVQLAYCSPADLRERASDRLLLKWADDDNDGALSSGEESSIAGAIASAATHVDQIVQAAYATPICPVPDEVRALCARGALHLLATRRGFLDAEDDRYARQWERDLEFLTQVVERGLPLAGGLERIRSVESTTRAADTPFSYSRYSRSSGQMENPDFSRKLDSL